MNKFIRQFLINPKAAVEFAEDSITFNGITYIPQNDLAYFQYIMCHSLPTFNAHNYGMTVKTLVRSAASAKDQLLNIRHLIVENDEDCISEDRIVGHIKDVYLPTAEYIAQGLLTADLEPTDAMTEGMPVFALGCLYKRAKGMQEIIAEHQDSGGKWATSMECNFMWPNAGVLVEGKIVPLISAPVELAQAVLPDPNTGTPPTYSYEGKKVYLVGGGEDGEVEFVGGALTMYPADSKANILRMVASREAEVKKPVVVSREELPDSAFLFVEDTGEQDADSRTIPDSARHCQLFDTDGTINIDRLSSALTGFSMAKASTDTLSDVELRLKLAKKLTPLADEYFPQGNFARAYGEVRIQTKGGEEMDLIEMLKKLRASLDELSSTDGFAAFKEASGKVNEVKSAIYSVMEKCEDMVYSMAEKRAVAKIAEYAETHMPKEEHQTALAEASKAASEVAVTEARKAWEAELAEKDRIATVCAERIAKPTEAKVGEIPASLKDRIGAITADDEGDAVFAEMLTRLEARKTAVSEAKVELSEAVMGRVLATLADDDEVFQSELSVWSALVTGKQKASVDGPKKTPFVPPQKSTDKSLGDSPLGLC